MKIIKIIFAIAIFLFLTIITQIGGIAYLLSKIAHRWTDQWSKIKSIKISYRLLSFLLIYFIATFGIVPSVAKHFGRIHLPYSHTNHIQPLNIMTCLLNRNYVRPPLLNALNAAAEEINEQQPGTKINYLDACFPFIDKFPLFPHLSHNDGKKIDLSFCYIDAKTGKSTNECPSFIGYGICEEPRPDEEDTAKRCEAKGYLQYSLLRTFVPQHNKNKFTFDAAKTKTFIELLCNQNEIGKILIEPHLKTRLKLTSPKIRFHGCHAVRHDDHVHVQLK